VLLQRLQKEVQLLLDLNSDTSTSFSSRKVRMESGMFFSSTLKSGVTVA
jgi:hypothetical protein